MKNLLSENMLRFGTKNLSEVAKRELVLKSVMETINEHGLHRAVRQRLTEAGAPSNKTYAFDDTTEFADAYKLGVKRGAGEPDALGRPTKIGPMVYQSDTSVSEASAILSDLFKVLGGSNTSDAQAVINVLKKINMNNYYAILWKVRYGSSFKANNRFKSNFNCLTDYISKIGIEIPSATSVATSDDGRNPLGMIRNIFIDDTLYNWINSSMLPKYNSDEYISSTPKV